MKDYLNHFTLKLETLSPMHIGDGDVYEKSDFLVEGNQLYVFRGKKFYHYIHNHYPKADFESYIGNTGKGLKQFFSDYRISDDVYDEAVDRKLQIAEGNGGVNAKVFTFVRDPYGCPYIPGSSLKGAIRTALETALITSAERPQPSKNELLNTIRNEREEYESRKNREMPSNDKSFLRKTDNAMNCRLFRAPLFQDKHGNYSDADMVDDIMRAVIIGDSEPLSDEDIVVCTVASMGANDELVNTVQMVAECLRPNTVVRFPVTLDMSVYDRLKRVQQQFFSPEGLLQAIQTCWQNYVDKYIGRFGALDKKEKGSVLLLGKFTGFVSKTEEIALYDEQDARSVTAEVLNVRSHSVDLRVPYLVRCTRIGNIYYQIGRCQVSIES